MNKLDGEIGLTDVPILPFLELMFLGDDFGLGFIAFDGGAVRIFVIKEKKVEVVDDGGDGGGVLGGCGGDGGGGGIVP